MEFEFRPIGVWPGTPTKRPSRSRFRAPYPTTLKILDCELRHLGAKNVVLQIALTSSQIRLDGRPYANVRPTHAGIILSFDSKHGPLSYPCDSFDRWDDNLRAIALGLEHLRAVDRYGVTRRGEQYRGWSQLPYTPDSMTVSEAVEVFRKYRNGKLTRETLGDVYRAAVLDTHPDRGGKPEDFQRVQRAKEVLEKAL